MQSKIVQFGQELGVTIPAELVQALKLEEGQAVDVSVDPVTGTVTIRPPVRFYEGGQVSPDFLAVAEAVRQKYDAAFRELAK